MATPDGEEVSAVAVTGELGDVLEHWERMALETLHWHSLRSIQRALPGPQAVVHGWPSMDTYQLYYSVTRERLEPDWTRLGTINAETLRRSKYNVQPPSAQAPIRLLSACHATVRAVLEAHWAGRVRPKTATDTLVLRHCELANLDGQKALKTKLDAHVVHTYLARRASALLA